MPREQNLFQIFKINSTEIVQNNLDIKELTFKEAASKNAFVSAGDNIAFDQIRKLRGDFRSPKDFFKYIQGIRKDIKQAKTDGDMDKVKILIAKLNNELFVKDIVSVENTKKSDYRKVAKAGFYLNGIHFVRFSASAGQIRHNTVLFVNEEIKDKLYKILMCGLDERVKEINIAKLSAYFSLSTSSVLWITTPRVCVIKDFNTLLKGEKIDWITSTKDGKKSIEERSVDLELNSCDGQGLVDPGMAMKWSKEMGLDYVASSYVVRSIFVKGLVVPFDFREYAHEHGIEKIKDKWGTEYNVDEIDALISESQFKMHKYYKSWEDYMSYINKNDIKWGVARYNKKSDPEYSLTNYQYIQIMNIDEDDLRELIKPTVEWINKICSGDQLYALLYCMGGYGCDEEVDYNDVYSRAQNNAMKAVVKNNDFLKDSYVQSKIYKNIVECINRAKLGKIWMRGNYQFMISDPIAQCRSALGLSPDGEVPRDCVYSRFWLDREWKDKELVLLRSPCLDKHEANKCKVYDSEECEKWFKWIKSGIIYSIYDTSTLRASDSDFDGDICASYNDPIFIKGSMKDFTNPISYDKEQVKGKKICHKNFVETDIRGFGTKVGTYSNYSTIIEAMLPLFQGENQQRQRDELIQRKQLLREIIGQEIDRIKGVDAQGPDRDLWLKFQKVDEDDDDIAKSEKYYHNSLVINKKPYFFRYLYPELNEAYKKYENRYNLEAKFMFNMKMKPLLAKKDKTEEEKTFVKRYYKFAPLLNTNCIMNILCRQIEGTDFDIKFDKSGSVSMLPWIEGYNCDSKILDEFKSFYRRWNNKQVISYVASLYDYDEDADDETLDNMRLKMLDSVTESIREKISEMDLSPMEILTYVKELSKKYNKFNWSFAWDILGNDVLLCIDENKTYIPVDVESPEFGKEYLGNYYDLWKVVKEDKDGLD